MAKYVKPEIIPLHKATTAHFLKTFEAAKRPQSAVVYLEGGLEAPLYDSDSEYYFVQEANFHYLFGVREAGFVGLVHMDGRRVLFAPNLPEAYQIVMGKATPLSEIKAHYGVDEVLDEGELEAYLAKAAPEVIYVYTKGTNSDSGLSPAPLRRRDALKFPLDETTLHDALYEARTVKVPEEVALMRHTINATADAHRRVMEKIRPGMYEFELESIFYSVVLGEYGMRRWAYNPICPGGKNAAVLHWGHAGRPNENPLHDGDLVLMDLGIENHRYASDLTLTYPVNGKFTAKQKAVYDVVLKTQRACEAAMKPGVGWYDIHSLANRVILEGLKEIGLLRGDVDAMFAADVHFFFMPHGIGHLIGVDTHDVGGFTGGIARSTNCSLKKCRSGRVLEAGNIYTVEPGIYFIDFILEKALQDEKVKGFLVEEKLREYFDFGGIRIEDDVLVTETGHEVLDLGIPRTTEEIEAYMAQHH